MVFSSVPAYLDPANWQQQPNHHHLTGPTTAATTHHHPLPLPPPPPPPHHGSTTAGSIRPGSMADRARLANIPMPETASKCPRCESTNTKFCYFNNYSLSQPRHFCKTCRRYWTRGGALRNVPVGGGCRRNKRSSKGSRSKSPVSSDRPTGSSSSSAVSCNSGAGDVLGLAGAQIPPLRFMAPLHQLSEFGNDHIGLNYGSFSAPIGGAGDLNFQLGNAMAGGGGSILSMSVLDQLRLQQGQQFPLLGGLDISNSASSGLYPFEGGADQPASYGGSGGALLKAKMTSSLSTQMASVKMEDNNLSRQFMGMQGNDNQFWSTGTSNWAEISSFSSSAATNPI